MTTATVTTEIVGQHVHFSIDEARSRDWVIANDRRFMGQLDKRLRSIGYRRVTELVCGSIRQPVEFEVVKS